MRFLADESCDFAVVRALRADGHDVLAVSEVQQRSVDVALMRQALDEERILLTEDKDFGWLAFVANVESVLVRDQAAEIARAFTVLAPGSVRISRRLDRAR